MDRILVIDDEPMLLDLLKEYLSDGRYIVDTAEDGILGLKKIQAQEYDLIITDIKMPGLSGDQILDYVKNGKHSTTPVIGISGMPWLFKDSPFDAVLTKPFTSQQLLDVVADLILKTDFKNKSPLPAI